MNTEVIPLGVDTTLTIDSTPSGLACTSDGVPDHCDTLDGAGFSDVVCLAFDIADVDAVIARSGAVCRSCGGTTTLPGFFGEAIADGATTELVGAVWLDTTDTGEGALLDVAMAGTADGQPCFSWTGCGVLTEDFESSAPAA